TEPPQREAGLRRRGNADDSNWARTSSTKGRRGYALGQSDATGTSGVSLELSVFVRDGVAEQPVDARPRAGQAAAGFQAGGGPIPGGLPEHRQRGAGLSAAHAAASGAA